jgi:hypothetical protein
MWRARATEGARTKWRNGIQCLSVYAGRVQFRIFGPRPLKKRLLRSIDQARQHRDHRPHGSTRLVALMIDPAPQILIVVAVAK